jgi:hypothetical protein
LPSSFSAPATAFFNGPGSSTLKALNDSRAAKRSQASASTLPIALRATVRKSSSVPPLREVPMIL